MKKPNIVVAQEMYLSHQDKQRLQSLGNVKFYSSIAKTNNNWLKRVKNADIILSRKHGLTENFLELSNVFISVPFVAINWMNVNKLKKRNIKVAYSPGCNKHAVSEWIIGMMFNLVRKFPEFTNISDLSFHTEKVTLGLKDQQVTILGYGYIGKQVEKICQALEMKVVIFKRKDNLFQKVKNSLVVINTLSSNSSTHGLIDLKLFKTMQKGSYFITVTSNKIYDSDALIKALDIGHLAGAASDAGSITPNDSHDPYYLKLQKHPKILATPHISARTKNSYQTSNNIMVKNVEAWLKGKPINLIY